MLQDFLIIVGNPRRVSDLGRIAADKTGMSLHDISDGCQILTAANTWLIEFSAAGQSGIILGYLFDRQRSDDRVETIDTLAAEQIISTNGESLTRRYWGNYVAIIPVEGDRYRIIRDPSGGLSCYYTNCHNAFAFASTAKLLQFAMPRPVSINWPVIARSLQIDAARSEDTGLVGIQELLPGIGVEEKGGSLEITTLWSPWEFAGQANEIVDFRTAAALVRDAVLASTRSWTSVHKNIVISLSGGLDSSIVAAAVAECEAAAHCLSIFTEEPAGDERAFASLVADRFNFPLARVAEELDYVQLGVSHSQELPRPTSRAFSQSHDRIALDLAECVGASAHFMGGGGDNVFCYLQSPSPVADRLRREGITGAWSTAQDVARLADCSAVEAMWKGVRRAYFRSPAVRWKGSTLFLEKEVLSSLPQPKAHPWLMPPNGGLPGKSAHIAWLVGIQNYLEGFGRDRILPVISPLVAQPVVEACLRIPSWLWCTQGANRAVAREAFKEALPQQIVGRMTKGTPDSFVVQLFERHRSLITTTLCRGRLAAAGILDVPEIRKFLANDQPTRGVDYARIMRLVDVEAWLASWV